MENLINNAWKFTSLRDQAHITVGMKKAADETIYFVRDDGAGFDMDYASKLFVPFQRLHEKEKFSGSGIGLTTVKRIITRHGGRIWAEAGVDQGATFYFTLGAAQQK
jgi:light-regulated signal transduction histidine kinase (bacteriophytochrome)